MLFFLVFLGAWMNWIDTVYGKHPDSVGADPPKSVSGKQASAPSDAPEIPPMFRAEPAVIEAGRIVRGRSISRGIPSWFRTLTDGRVI